MQVDADTVYQRPAAEPDDDVFLRSTSQILLAAQRPNASASHAAFDALKADHLRVQAPHFHRLILLTAAPIR